MQRARNDRGTGRGALRIGTGALVMTMMVAGAPWRPGVPSEVGAVEPAQDERRIEVRTARRAGGSRVGLSVTDLETAAEALREGARVIQITPDGPAADAGFQVGDVIVEFDGERVRSARQLSRLVEETPAGRAVTAAVRREGSSLELELTPESGLDRVVSLRGRHRDDGVPLPEAGRFRLYSALPDGLDLDWDMEDFDIRMMRGGRRLGIQGLNLGEQLADYFAVEAGVLVASVDEGSVGARAGLRAGDVITEVGDQPVEGVMSLRRLVRRLDADETFTIGVTRDGRSMELEGRFSTARRSPGVSLGI